MASENDTIRARAPRHAHAVSTAQDAVRSSANADVAEVRLSDAAAVDGPRHRRPAVDQKQVGGHARHAVSSECVPSHARHAETTEKPRAASEPEAADSLETAVPVSSATQPAPNRKETVPVARYRVVVAGLVAAIALFAIVLVVSPFNPMKALQGNDDAKRNTVNVSIGTDYGQNAYADDRIPVSEEDQQLLSQIVVDGSPIENDAIAAIASTQAPFTDQVGVINQNSAGLPSGCEVVSLAVLLQSLGFDVDPTLIADEYLIMDGNFGTGYAGSPYGAGGGYPPGIVDAANGYLLTSGSDAHAYDLTGTSFDGLKGLVWHGYPVLVWSTLFGEEPMFSDTYDGDMEWYVNEHCVVVFGVTDEGVLISDPIEGYAVCDEEEFARIYDLCGNMAAAVL